MSGRDNFKLRFGPYSAPLFRVGQEIHCRAKGDVVIHAIRETPVGMWPLVKPSGVRAGLSLALYGDLVVAVQRESAQAVAKAWGVDVNLVTRWRKALGVLSTNEGTAELRAELAAGNILREDSKAKAAGAQKMAARKRMPVLSGTKLWHDRPIVIDCDEFRRARVERKWSRSQLAAMLGISSIRISQIERGINPRVRTSLFDKIAKLLPSVAAKSQRPVKSIVPWTEAEDENLRSWYGQVPVEEIAGRLATRSVDSIFRRAQKLGLTTERKVSDTRGEGELQTLQIRLPALSLEKLRRRAGEMPVTEFVRLLIEIELCE